MELKSIILFVVLLFILLVGGSLIYSNYMIKDTVKVGTAEFNLPNGYKEGELNEFGAVSISNGTNTVYLSEYNSSDPQESINQYLNIKKGDNMSVYITEFDVSGSKIYKTKNLNETKNTHYWFVKDNKTYEIYSWAENPEMDNIVMEFINS